MALAAVGISAEVIFVRRLRHSHFVDVQMDLWDLNVGEGELHSYCWTLKCWLIYHGLNLFSMTLTTQIHI